MSTLGSTVRRAVFLSVLALCLVPAKSALAEPILTGDPFILQSRDDRGTRWTGSVLVFTSQVQSGDDYSLEGYFDWVSNGGAPRGRELFRGVLTSDLVLDVSCYQLINHVNIFLVRYIADVRPDGDAILNGSWSGSGIPGDFEAFRVIPEPTSLVLFGLGAAGVALWRSRRVS